MDSSWPGLTEQQWDKIKLVIPPEMRTPRPDWLAKKIRRRRRRTGRPPVPDKKAFEALVWTMGGGTLDRLPRRFGSRRTAIRRIGRWFPDGIVERLWRVYLDQLTEEERQRWAAAVARRKRLPFWQQMLLGSLALFTRLPECEENSTPLSSMPESSSPGSMGP
jgi:hypothetical protein